MAKIPTYPALTAPDNNDELVIEDSVSASTKKITRGDLLSGTPLPADTVDTQAITDSSVTTAKINDGAVIPAKRSGGFYIGIIAGATLGSTGNKSITGVGFTPKLVRFTGLPASSNSIETVAIGAMSTTTQFMLATASSGSAASRNGNTVAAFGFINVGSASLAMRATYVSMDVDGFTINVGTANTALDWAYECYG